MEHLVRYELASGETRYDTVMSLEAAIAMVERLRNEEGTSNVEVFRHVPLEFKTYYKVVVADDAAQNAPTADNPTSANAEEPPPGAMPLNPPAQPRVQVHETGDAVADGEVAPEDGSGDDTKRSSLFSRG